MPNKMLIDATHPEETRVVVLRGNRVEEFDFESASRKQLRGNIYLAKVTRVEPSLQAAFVDYGGNRHGFLAFSEIHPDYYQIPVADRQALIDEEEREAREADAEADNRAVRRSRHERHVHRRRDEIKSEPVGPQQAEGEGGAMAAASELMAPEASDSVGPSIEQPIDEVAAPAEPAPATTAGGEIAADPAAESNLSIDLPQLETSSAAEPLPADVGDISAPRGDTAEAAPPAEAAPGENITEVNGNGAEGEEEAVESVGGADVMEEVPERAPRLRRQYKIQEVIKRRQVMLVQVVKEERGTKGAALTTYLSLAGRYSVLMPNTARGGGISRKITDVQDRRRLKELVQELEVPEGMGVILRTAGAARTKSEIKRDFEYLLRLWETVRDLTLRSTAPTLVYEEGSLVKRSIRDLYNKDIDEILVAGDQGYKEARDFMHMLMPSHSRNVKPYRDTLPIFTRFGIESQLDAMFQPVVQLRSGGYVVLNQTEALVAIDVNSGRATREHHIEDTALKTNLEAAEEIARQLRLRDLAGLIVIDFIDMDEKRNNRTVERRLKDALKHDRARIQVGHISHFGLLEMSRQRIRSSVLESSTEKCPNCGGTGHVRSVASVSLQLLRSLEETLLKSATHNLSVRTRTEIALYLLNHKRAHLRALEERFQLTITINADATIAGQLAYVVEKGEQVHSPEQAKAIAAAQPAPLIPFAEEEEPEAIEPGADEEAPDEDAERESAGAEGLAGEGGEAVGGEREGGRRRRRRRGRRGEAREGRAVTEAQAAPAEDEGGETEDEGGETEDAEAEGGRVETAGEPREGGRRRRRGRRGGRRNRRDREGEAVQNGSHETPEEQESFAAPAEAEATEWSDSAAQAPAIEHFAARAEPQPSPYAQEPRTTAAEQPDVPSAAPAASEPRRRSTVREPAPPSFESTQDSAPPAEPQQPAPAQPVVVSSSDENENRPRRSGWWSRRG